MTASRDDTIYIEHMLECIRRIETNVAGGRKGFMTSHTLQDAVLRNLQTLEEASQRLSGTLKVTQPQIPWREIAAFRNVLVHNYLGIDLDTVWVITQRDLPPLKQALLSMHESRTAPEEQDDESGP
jgi:uncharacterized protein with HEPN domain